MKKLFLILAVLSFGLNLHALEIKMGKYKLIEGDEDLCEEGTVRLLDGDLRIGNRLAIMQIEKTSYTYEEDDKSCTYLVKNFPQKNGLKQESESQCKEGGKTVKHIFLTYLPPKLSYTIISDTLKNKKLNCSLEFVK